MFGFSLDRLKDAISLRDLGYIALAALFCGFVLFLDIRTSSDITEPFLTPLAFIAIYPVNRNWATFLTAVLALGTVVLVGRFGGEELVVLLPHTDEPGGIIAAERIREAVGQVMVEAGDKVVTFTVSIGATTYARRVKAEQILECADQALYVAKQGGRNQVRVGRIAETGSRAPHLAPA